MSVVPLLIVIQAFVLSTWSMVMLVAFVVTRDDDPDQYAVGVDFTSRTIIPD